MNRHLVIMRHWHELKIVETILGSDDNFYRALKKMNYFKDNLPNDLRPPLDHEIFVRMA